MKVFQIALCVILVAALPFRLWAADEEVTQMIRAFYKWYVPHLDQSAGTMFDHGMSNYVTDRLLARIKRLNKTEKEGVPALDYDPFLNAQDYSPDWATKVAVRDVRVNHDKATATVVLGEKSPSTVHLSLTRSGGKWKIDNFVPKL